MQKFMYQYKMSILYTIFENAFKLNQDGCSYNTRQPAEMLLSVAMLEIRLRSIRNKGAIIWNYF